MIFCVFLVLSLLAAEGLARIRQDTHPAWDLFDGAVVAALLTAMIVEYRWWFGLIQHILEYNNA